MENNREGFGSNFGFIMAAVGSAVGLGNIWGFPYKMGRNGGFAFLLVYLVLALFVGLAVMVGELALGRKTGLSPIAAYRKASEKWTWVGVMAVAVPFLVLCFYFVLGGMVMRYAVGYLLALMGIDSWMNVTYIKDFFGTFLCSGGVMVLWTAIFIVLNAIIVAGGVGNGIEKFCNIGMPCLFVILIICIVYVAVQPGAVGGYQFMFGWNIEPLKTDFLTVLKTAAGQMFFSLSLGMGAMITYGSYLAKGEKLQKNAVIIVVMDTMVAIMAGMIVLPSCYAFGVDTGAGPGLLFKSMQVVFSHMGGFIGNLMGFLFYFLVFIAAISSSMSLLEAITASRVDANVAKGKAPARKKTAVIFALIIFVFCIPTALDALGTGTRDGAPIACPAEMLNGYGYSEISAYQPAYQMEGDEYVIDSDGYKVAITEFEDGVTYYVANEDGSFTAEDTFSSDSTYYVDRYDFSDLGTVYSAENDAAVIDKDSTEYVAGTTYYTHYINGVKGWNDCWLDFYDMLSEGVMMPLGALFLAILIGWVWKIDFVIEEAEQCGNKFWGKGFFNLCYKFITPIGMLFVLYGQLTGFFG